MTIARNLKIAAVAALGILTLTASTCESQADVASRNLSIEAEEFRIQRLIVGINGITGEVLFSVEGRCSIERGGDALIVTCKHAEDDLRKHYVGLSDNTTYVSTQLEAVDVSTFHTKIILKPTQVFADYDLTLGEN